MTVESAPSKSETTLKPSEEKWGKDLMQAGWVIFPSIFLEYQHKLGLSPIQMNIILQLAAHWWEADNAPFPSKKTLAQRMDVSPSTIQRQIRALEDRKLVKRETRMRDHKDGGQTSNIYRLDGLIEEATKYAKAKLEEKRKQQEERKAASKRGTRPRAQTPGSSGSGE